MEFSRLVGKTLRQPPSEAHLPSHQLLARAGYVHGFEAGLFAYLPLGQRVLQRLQGRIRGELEMLGSQEVVVPTLPEAEPGQGWVRLVGREVDSYRQLPVLLFQQAVRTVAQPRVRAGLFGANERPFVEIYAFAGADMATPEVQIDLALARVLQACEVATVWAEAGSEGSRAFFVHASGDEEMVRCPGCGYAAARPWATTAWPGAPEEPELPTEEVETPDCNTIAALAQFLGIPTSRTLKMVFYSVAGKVTCVVIRGDRAVDEDKLARVLGTDRYYASLEDELEEIGAVGGYASPIGLNRSKVRVVADPSVRSGKNLVSGANRAGYHIRNVNVPRDFSPGEWIDLARVEAGDACPHCGTAMTIEPAFAVAYHLRPAPCRPEVEYLDPEGKAKALWTASWALDLGRLLAAVVEAHHDEAGIVWPPACAPFDVHLVVLDTRKEAVAEQAESLRARLQSEWLTVLYDDRDASAGVKFHDADLMGMPLRLTVSKRAVEEGIVEAKWRDQSERLRLDEEGLAAELDRLQERL